jgi:ankyrin repeat protein
LILAISLIVFSVSLKSSIEQAMLYLGARQALGEVTADAARLPLRQEAEAKPSRWWPYFKTYAPACALLVLMSGFQLLKFPFMTEVLNSRELYTVKALQAAGVPLPLWTQAGGTPTRLQRWLRQAGVPFGWRSFQPYAPHIIQSQAMMKFLLEKGVDVNAPLSVDASWTPPGISKINMTPLMVALTDRRVETARSLIAPGADVRARDSIGRSPLTVALTYCPAAIGLLLAHGADPNEPTRFGPPLLAAARYQWLYPMPNRRDPWFIREQENAVKILLEKGVDPNTHDSEGRNALMVMSMERRPGGHQTRMMIGERVDLIGRVIMAGKHIFEVSGGPNEEPNKAVQLIGEALLQAGCDLNAADSNGRTPLMYAVRYQQPTAVRLLLEHGADVKAKDKSSLTALDLAKQSGNKEMIGWLQGAVDKAR